MGWRCFGEGSDADDFFCSAQMLYTGRVSEDAGPGLFILKISATDPDVGSNAQITYSLHGPGAEEFRLGPHTGEGRAVGCFHPLPHPPPGNASSQHGSTQGAVHSSCPKLGRNGHSVEESELHIILFAFITNVKMKGRHYC